MITIPHLLSAAAMTLAFMASATAQAQVAQPVPVPDLTQPAPAPELVSVGERAHPELDTPGLHLGSFIAHPALDLSEEFNSNIYGLPSPDVRSDFITLMSPSLDIASDWNDNAIGLHAESDIAKHARFAADDTTNAILQADGRLDIFHDQTLSLGAGYQALHEDRSSPESIAQAQAAGAGGVALHPTPFDVATANFAYIYSASRLSLELDGNLNAYTFANVATDSGTLEINSDQNREEYTLMPRLSYSIDPNFKPFIQIAGDIRSYDTEHDATPDHYRRSSKGYNAAAGTTFNIDRIITGQFYIGWQSQNYDDPRLQTISGVSFGGFVLWNVTQLTSLKLSTSRSTQETILVGASGLFDTSLEASVEHELFRNVLVSLGVTYDDAAYQGTIKQVDDSYGFNAAVRWKLDRNFSAGVQVNYTTRTSNVAIDRFDRNEVVFDIKGQF